MYKLAIIIFSFCFYANINAGIYYFLKDLPISSFTDDDMTLMSDNVFKALETAKDGEKFAWENKKTGHSGLANPLKTYKQEGLNCRTVRIVNRAKKQIAESKYEVCKVKDNSWKIMTK